MAEDPPDGEARVAELQALFPDAEAGQLRGFLVSAAWDAAAAAERFRKHLEWRRETFPVERNEAVMKVLNSKRFRYMGVNSENRGVLLFNGLHGRFLDGITPEDATRAYLAWTEDTIGKMHDAGAEFAWVHIAIGGAPPLKWAKGLHQMLEAHYPERLHVAVAHVPKTLQTMVKGTIQLLPKRTQMKCVCASNMEELCQAAGIGVDDWPEDISLEWDSREQWVDTDERGLSRFSIRQAVDASGTASVDFGLHGLGDEEGVWTASLDDKDVDLSVIVETDDGTGELFCDRITAGEPASGEIDPAWQGTLRFEIDNSFSWLTGKVVTMSVSQTVKPGP